jgi:hypothetical protein
MYESYSSLRKNISMLTQVVLKMDMYVQSASEYPLKSMVGMNGSSNCIQREAGMSAKNCFFLGNVMTLHNHIAR